MVEKTRIAGFFRRLKIYISPKSVYFSNNCWIFVFVFSEEKLNPCHDIVEEIKKAY